VEREVRSSRDGELILPERLEEGVRPRLRRRNSHAWSVASMEEEADPEGSFHGGQAPRKGRERRYSALQIASKRTEAGRRDEKVRKSSWLPARRSQHSEQPSSLWSEDSAEVRSSCQLPSERTGERSQSPAGAQLQQQQLGGGGEAGKAPGRAGKTLVSFKEADLPADSAEDKTWKGVLQVRGDEAGGSLRGGLNFKSQESMLLALERDDEVVRQKRVIHPYNPRYQTWSRFCTGLVLLTGFLTPLRFALLSADNVPATVLDSALDALFGIDILVTCNLGYHAADGSLVTSRAKIFTRYLVTGRLLVDLAATLPFDLMWAAATGEKSENRVFAALGLIRLIRLNRLLVLFRELMRDARFDYFSIIVVKFVLCIILSTHTTGCLFYAVARDHGYEDSWVVAADPDLPQASVASKYMHVLYWAVATFKAGPASGFLMPTNEYEMLLASVTMVLNISLNVYLVGTLAALLTKGDAKVYNVRQQLQQLAEFSNRHSLPADLRLQLRRQLELQLDTEQESEQAMIASLPEVFRQQIHQELYGGLLERCPLFSKCNALFLQQLNYAVQSQLYLPNQTLVHEQDASSQLFVVAEGVMELCVDGEVREQRGAGEAFCEPSFLFDLPEPFAVRTKSLSRVLSISKHAWEKLRSKHPREVHRVQLNLHAQCKERGASGAMDRPGRQRYELLAHEMSATLIRQQDESATAMCAAAARGDLAQLNRSLAVGCSPNAADYDRRTPLHIAAAKGQLEAIGLLIDAGAGTSPLDNFGRTPLQEACRSRQYAAAQLLHYFGAELRFSTKLTLASQLKHDGTESVEDGYLTENEDDGRTEDSRTTLLEERAQEAERMEALNRHVEGAELCAAAASAEMTWYLKMLLKFGADANSTDYDNRGALHLAACEGNERAISLLLQVKTIDVNVRDRFGRTPLMEAVRHGKESCARLLRRHGAGHGFVEDNTLARTEFVHHLGQELCQAAFSNNRPLLKNLVELCEVDVNTSDYDGRTALHLACATGSLDTAVLLARSGANTEAKDRWGHTPLSEAESHGFRELRVALEAVTKCAAGAAGAAGEEEDAQPDV